MDQNEITTKIRNMLGLPAVANRNNEYKTWKTLPDGTAMRIRHSVDLTRFYAIKSKMGG